MERSGKLKAAMEEAQRRAKPQAAPFRNSDGPKPNPKKPGRKSGRRHGKHAHAKVLDKVDEHYDVTLPIACPQCGGRHIEEAGVATQ